MFMVGENSQYWPDALTSAGLIEDGSLGEIVAAAGRGQIKSAIHASYPLGEAARAHEEMERADHFGKFVLTVG